MDQCLPLVLFAYREIPVEGLGFSPFELLFGRNVRGPLQLVKDMWAEDNKDLANAKPNVIKYMIDLRERLSHCQSVASNQAKQSRLSSKKWYDRRAREHVFEVGQLVLVFLPMNGKLLDAKYQGPYKILQRIGPIDYVIELHDKRKNKRAVHVNMLKLYHKRDWKFTNRVTCNIVEQPVTLVDDDCSWVHL